VHILCSACSKATFILIHKVVSKTRKNEFRTEDSIGSLIGTKIFFWSSLRFITELDLITTSTNTTLERSLRKEMFRLGTTSMRVFRISKQCLELQSRLAAQGSSLFNQPQ
jgi:hypothetical protein